MTLELIQQVSVAVATFQQKISQLYERAYKGVWEKNFLSCTLEGNTVTNKYFLFLFVLVYSNIQFAELF